jgi:hypothetical protein
VKESHVESHRLFELAELPAIIDQPEWNHIKHCPDCGVAFIRLVDLREGCFSRIVWDSGSGDPVVSQILPDVLYQFNKGKKNHSVVG